MANRAAIALSNAQQYEELIRQNSLLNRRIDLLAKLIKTNQSLQPDLPLERSLESIALGIQESTPFNIVLISMYEQQTQSLIRTCNVGLSLELMAELQASPQTWKGRQNLFQDEFRLGNAYFIPYEKMPVMPVDIHSVVPISLDFAPAEPNDWHPEDVLLFPLVNPDGHPLGLISLDDPRDGNRPDRATLESLEIFASQAAYLIEVYQKINTLGAQNIALQNDLRLLEDHRFRIDVQTLNIFQTVHCSSFQEHSPGASRDNVYYAQSAGQFFRHWKCGHPPGDQGHGGPSDPQR